LVGKKVTLYTKEGLAQMRAQQPTALVYLDQFMGAANTSVPVMLDDLISIKTDHLKFRLNNQEFEYSGHYAIWITQARKHSTLGFGAPEKAKYVHINGSGLDMPLTDATIWEKRTGFIDVEAMGQEFICSGSFEIQN
jgi:hypothetical protein